MYKTAALIVMFFFFALVSCGDAGFVRTDNTQQSGIPDDKKFIATGSGGSFGDAKNAAYQDMLKKAIVFLVGDQNFNSNADAFGRNFLNIKKAGNYIAGVRDTVNDDKMYKWDQSKDSSGAQVFQLTAYVYLKKLKADIDAMGLNLSTTSVNNNNTTRVDSTGSTSSSTGSVSSTGGQNNTTADLSGVDISSLSVMVFFDTNDIAKQLYAKDAENENKIAIDSLNGELSKVGVKTFNINALQQLIEERNLMQESSTGNLGVTLMLAQQVQAELYAQVATQTSYDGENIVILITVEVFSRSTGRSLGVIKKGASWAKFSSESASVAGSIKETVKKLKDDMINLLKKYINDGRFYFIRLKGVSSKRDALAFEDALRKIDGLKVYPKTYTKADKVADYDAQYKGEVGDLTKQIFKNIEGLPGFDKFDSESERGTEFIFTME